MRQNDPLPGSSCDLGTFTKNRFSERLCRIEFYKKTNRTKQTCIEQYTDIHDILK